MSADRGLPISVEAERAILGAILLDNRCYYQAEPVLKAGDFGLDSHRRIYLRFQDLFAREAPIDFVTVTEELSQHNEVESVGGIAYVTSLTDGLPRVRNIEQYVKIVKDKAMLRELIHLTSATQQQAYEQDVPAENVLETAQTGLIQIVGNRYKEVSLVEIGRQTFQKLELERQAHGDCIGATSGLPDLDVMTTGFRDGELVIIGARPGNGKTALVCQGISANVLKARKVGFFSSEVPEDQILIRLACQHTGIHVFDTRDPRMLELNGKYMRLIEEVCEIATQWDGKLFLDATPCIEIEKLCARARAWVSKGVDLIFVDYLQILTASGKTEYEQVTNAVKALWHLARSTGAKLVVLSQLNRNNQNTRPTMGDLRSSGAIENFANLILLLWRDLQMNDDGEICGHTGQDEIIIPKQRSGPSQVCVKVSFDAPVGIWKPRAGNIIT